MQPAVIFGVFAIIIAVTFLMTPRRITKEGFFGGIDWEGTPPGLWTLVLSQVTTWIFARSLMNSAILGYYYGIAGVLGIGRWIGSRLAGSAFRAGRSRLL